MAIQIEAVNQLFSISVAFDVINTSGIRKFNNPIRTTIHIYTYIYRLDISKIILLVSAGRQEPRECYTRGSCGNIEGNSRPCSTFGG